MADTTVATYMSVARTFVLWCLEEDVSPPTATKRDLSRYLAARHKQARTTFANTNIGLRAFFTFCVEQGWCRRSPMTGFPVPRVVVEPQPGLTLEQVQALIDACENYRDYALILVLSLGGIRARELLHMRVEHIDWDQGEVMIYAKGRRHRTVTLPPIVLDALRGYVRWDEEVWRRLRRPHAPLKHPGEPWRIVGRIAKAAGIRATPHMLRRSLASAALANGADVGALQALLGHKTATMSLHYASWANKGRADAAQQRVADKLTG